MAKNDEMRLADEDQAKAMQELQDEYDRRSYRIFHGNNPSREDAESIMRQRDIRDALQKRSDELRYAYPPKNLKNYYVGNNHDLQAYETPYGNFQVQDLPWKHGTAEQGLYQLDRAAMGPEAHDRYLRDKQLEYAEANKGEVQVEELGRLPPDPHNLNRLPAKSRLDILLDWLGSKLR